MRIIVFILLSLSLICIAEERHIIIDKAAYKLSVIQNQDTIFQAPICIGKNFGQKTKKGDNKTPEGKFTISHIQDSRRWKHDFNDGKGEILGSYGPWFFRLKTPKWTDIGIHGTCFPQSIGTRDSEGCIRLLNDDLIKLKKLVFVGMNVEILPDIVNETDLFTSE